MNTSFTPASLPVEKLKNQYVTRKKDSKTVYLVDGYCRFSKKYALTDTNDFCRQIYVKKGTLLFIQ